MIETTKKNTATVDVTEVKDNAVTILLLNQQIGLLSANNANLRLELSKIKTKEQDEITRTEKVKVIHTERFSPERIEYINLEDITKEIETNTLKQLKYNKSDLENKILDFEIEIDNIKAKLDREKLSFNKSLRNSVKDIREEYEKQVTKLEEELEKERNNKTNKELEAKRKKEIVDLREQIATLKAELDRIRSMNSLRKFWYKITHRKVEEIVEVKLQAKERREKEIVCNSKTRRGNGCEWNPFPW